MLELNDKVDIFRTVDSLKGDLELIFPYAMRGNYGVDLNGGYVAHYIYYVVDPDFIVGRVKERGQVTILGRLDKLLSVEELLTSSRAKFRQLGQAFIERYPDVPKV